MKALWLACCSCKEYPRALREIETRDAGACVLRLSAAHMAVGVVSALAETPRGLVMFEHRSADEDPFRLLREATCVCNGLHVVVLTSDLDPAWIARLFQAGAAEVVALEEDEHKLSAEIPPARAGVGGDQKGGRDLERDSAPFVTSDSGAQDVPETLTCNARRAVGDTALQNQDARHDRSGTASEPAAGYDDLDEPPWDEPGKLSPAEQRQEMAEHERNPLLSRSSRAADGVPNVGAKAAVSGKRAPVVCAVSGSGGSGATTIVAAMACYAAQLGLRTAVLDLDLMFGNLYELFGVEACRDLTTLSDVVRRGDLDEASIVQASMRIAPGLTLWGPIASPERAELMGEAVEGLIEVLRRESDVILVDTSRTWTDAVASAVAECDRCLLICDHAVGSATALERAVGMVGRLGVPKTRMACVVNRVGQHACTEDAAMRLEMAASLSAKTRIPDGGDALMSFCSFGRIDEAVRSQGAFARSVKTFTRGLLRELGCPVGADPAEERRSEGLRPRLRLPWNKTGGRS